MTGDVASSVWKGLANVAGLPWDTIENVYNLGKAGVHAAGTAMGMTDRPFQAHTGVLGGSESIKDAMRRARLITPGSDPESFMGRVADSAIQMGTGGMLTPGAQMRSIPQALRLGASGAASGAGAEVGASVAPEGFEPVGRQLGALSPSAGRIATPPTRGEEATAGRKAERFGKAYDARIPVPPREMKADKPQQALQDQLNQELRQPPGTEISPKTLQAYRDQHWSAYEQIIKSPLLSKGVQPNAAFQKEIQQIGNEIESARASLPETFKSMRPVLKLLGEYGYGAVPPAMAGKVSMPPRQQPIPADVTMRAIKKLRDDANTNFQSEHPEKVELAKVQKRIANSLENLVESNLQAVGPQQLVKQFRDARTAIAKSHDIENALDPVTGQVSGARLSKLLSEGRPLSGKLETMAEVSQAFPTATRPEMESDLFTKRVTPMAIEHPQAMGAHWLTRMGRPITHSRPYQRMVVDPRNKQAYDQEMLMRWMLGAQAANIPQPPPQ